MNGIDLFVYGTLQYPAIAAAVTGERLAGTPAVLDGYARHAVRDAPYPGIVPRAGRTVEGVLYENIDPVARRRIDTFEGTLYHRETVAVRRLDDGAAVTAQTYVVRPGWRVVLARVDWDPDAFARRWHDAYVRDLEAERRAGQLE